LSHQPHCPTGLDRPFASARAAFVAGHGAPLIDERAAARRRIATEGCDGHAGVKSALSVRALASRTASRGGNLDALAVTRPTETHWGRANCAEPSTRFSPRVLCAAHVVRPRSAARRRMRRNARAASQRNMAISTFGARLALSVRAPASRTGSRGGNLEPLAATRPSEARKPNHPSTQHLILNPEPHCPSGLDERCASARGRLPRPQRCAAHRRTRRIARAQVAISTPVRKRLSVRTSARRAPARTTRPGTRTLLGDLGPWELDERPHSFTFVARHDGRWR
jgi:hypothetical protein